MKIIYQGQVKLSEQPIYYYPEVKAIMIDLKTKRGEVNAGGITTGGVTTPAVFVSPCEDSIYLKDTDVPFTEIAFPEFIGWYVLNAQIDKYNLNITFVKEK